MKLAPADERYDAAGVVLSALFLRRVPVTANFREQLDIFRDKHTWIMTAIYVMTFGAFSGFAAQLALIIRSEYGSFADAPDPLKFAFLGPLVGSLVRALMGPLCDRFGGAVWTFVSGVGMTVSTVFAASSGGPMSAAHGASVSTCVPAPRPIA